MNATELRTEVIRARASTRERLVAEQVAAQLGLANQAQLVRCLINEKATELGVA
jgi:hypothetical protein